MKKLFLIIFLFLTFTKPLGAQPVFSPDFVMSDSEIRVSVHGLDPRQRYWAFLIDPTTQDVYQSQYYEYQTIGGRQSAEISFSVVAASNLQVRLHIARRGSEMLTALDIKTTAPQQAGSTAPASSAISISSVELPPVQLGAAPIMIDVEGLEDRAGYMLVAFDAALTAPPMPSRENLTFYRGFSGPRGGGSLRLGANIRTPGRYTFQIYANYPGAPMLAETTIEVVSAAQAQSVHRPLPEILASDFSPMDVPEDIFLDRYEGAWPCGSLAGNRFILDITGLSAGVNTPIATGRYFLLDTTGSVMFSGEIHSTYVDRGTRRFNLRFASGYEAFREAGKREAWPPGDQIQGVFSPKFDRVEFDARAANCSPVTLTALENSPAPAKQPPEAGTFEAACFETDTLAQVSACIVAALEKNKTENGTLNHYQLDDWKRGGLFYANCQSLTAALEDLTRTITRDYFVEFERLPRNCEETFEVLAPLGFANPVPDECRRITTPENVPACINAFVSQQGSSAELRRSVLGRDAASCRAEGGAPGYLQVFLTNMAMFDHEYSESEANRLRKRVTCAYYYEAAAAIGLISEQERDEQREAAATARSYACSAERAATQPNRMDMINALGRRIAGQCSASFAISQWLGGGNNSPFAAALFQFTPTEKSCEMRFKLSSVAAAPEYVIWAADFDNRQCRPDGVGRFQCDGDFLLGFSSNDTRSGAALLENLLIDRSRRLAVTFEFDSQACTWRAARVTPE